MEDNFKGKIEIKYSDSTPYWEKPKSAPEGAPNVLYILLDDTGYAQVGCYGSLIETPNIDALAADGIRYRDFHVNAMCSPTRASLLTGCNNHTVGFCWLGDNDFGFPNLRGEVDPKYGFISETLHEAGYYTFTVGKWHLINHEHMSPAGPFDQWPSGRGFDKSYTLLKACTSQWNPFLVQGNEIVDPPKSAEEGYQFSEDIVDKAIKYIGEQKSFAPDQPFFGYVAFGAMHGPHHAPKEYIDRFKGQFDEGWDVYREKVFARQKELGIIPENAVLTERNSKAQPWDSLNDYQKKAFARYMEVFAGFLTYTDDQIGRLVDYLKEIGQYDNTVIVFMTDNGASPEGGTQGCYNEFYHIFTHEWEGLLSDELLESMGSARSNCNYPSGWAWAGNTPLKWYKSWVHAGGVKVPCIITWPNGIKAKGEVRNQFHHVIDIYPTILELCGVKQPEYIKGIRQEAKAGISMAYTFDNPDAPTERHVQYFEMHGNRGIWKDGWKAVTDHVDSPSFEQDIWELYNTDEDFSEANDLASVYPEKLEELKTLWWHEAGKYGVLPLIESHHRTRDGFMINKMWVHSPYEYRTHYRLYPVIMPSLAKPYFGGKDFSIVTRAEFRKGDEGVLFSVGQNAGGFAVYVEDGLLKFHNNFLMKKGIDIIAGSPVPEGIHDLEFFFEKQGPDAGTGYLKIDGQIVGQGEIACSPLFPTPGAMAVGRYGTSVIKLEHEGRGFYKYTGKISYVDVDLDRPNSEYDTQVLLHQALQSE